MKMIPPMSEREFAIFGGIGLIGAMIGALAGFGWLMIAGLVLCLVVLALSW